MGGSTMTLYSPDADVVASTVHIVALGLMLVVSPAERRVVRRIRSSTMLGATSSVLSCHRLSYVRAGESSVNDLLHRNRATLTDPGSETNRAEWFCQFFSNKIHNIATVVPRQMSCCRAVQLRPVASRPPMTLLERFEVVTVHDQPMPVWEFTYTDFIQVWLLILIFDAFRFSLFFKGCRQNSALIARLVLVTSALILGYDATASSNSTL